MRSTATSGGEGPHPPYLLDEYPPPAFTPNRSPLAIDQRSLAVTLFLEWTPLSADSRQCPRPARKHFEVCFTVQVTVRDFSSRITMAVARLVGEEIEAAVTIAVL